MLQGNTLSVLQAVLWRQRNTSGRAHQSVAAAPGLSQPQGALGLARQAPAAGRQPCPAEPAAVAIQSAVTRALNLLNGTPGLQLWSYLICCTSLLY